MGLQENLNAETVRSLPLRNPVTVSLDSTLNESVEKMQSRRLGCAVVIAPDGKPVGMFTESQLVRLLAEAHPNFNRPVSELMETDWPTVDQNAPIVEVLNLMRKHDVRFIIVVDQEGILVGLTGQRGLLEYVADHFPEQVMVQRIGGTPHLGNREGA